MPFERVPEIARPVLIVPGLFNSPADHWQSHWQDWLPTAERVEQSDWEQPRLGDWTAALAEAVRARSGALLVAHSLGCGLVAHLSAVSGGRGIGGALLVAPADPNPIGPAGRLLQGFAPMPGRRLPFPTTVIASRTDPYVGFDRAEAFAAAWGARLVDLGDAGHINVASGHGPWVEGLSHLADLDARVAAAAPALTHA